MCMLLLRKFRESASCKSTLSRLPVVSKDGHWKTGYSFSNQCSFQQAIILTATPDAATLRTALLTTLLRIGYMNRYNTNWVQSYYIKWTVMVPDWNFVVSATMELRSLCFKKDGNRASMGVLKTKSVDIREIILNVSPSPGVLHIVYIFTKLHQSTHKVRHEMYGVYHTAAIVKSRQSTLQQ